jgi:hypothetical protein
VRGCSRAEGVLTCCSVWQDIGDRVECNIGEWARGTVIKTWYREDEWPEDKWAAYQVKLDMGQYIYAPIDQDKVCRAAPDGDSGPTPESLQPEPPREPMTWDEIRQWDTYVSPLVYRCRHPARLLLPRRQLDRICLR